LIIFDHGLQKLTLSHNKAVVQLDRHFLLLLKDELVILHVFFGVGFKVSAQFVKIQTVFVCALLTIQEELAELGCSK
jgi:hypothetical protein